jgi:hypothetical protein
MDGYFEWGMEMSCGGSYFQAWELAGTYQPAN